MQQPFISISIIVPNSICNVLETIILLAFQF